MYTGTVVLISLQLTVKQISMKYFLQKTKLSSSQAVLAEIFEEVNISIEGYRSYVNI